MNTTSEESDLKQNIRLLRSCTNPWRIEFAAIQTKSLRVCSPLRRVSLLLLTETLLFETLLFETLREREREREQGCLTAYADPRKIKGLKPAKAGFVCVAANSIRQVQNIRLETLIDALISQMLEESNRGKTGYSKYLCIHHIFEALLEGVYK